MLQSHGFPGKPGLTVEGIGAGIGEVRAIIDENTYLLYGTQFIATTLHIVLQRLNGTK